VPGYVQMFNVPLNTFGPHHAPVLQQARIPQPNSQPVQLGMKPELRDDLEVGLNPTLVETEERMAREFENKVDKWLDAELMMGWLWVDHALVSLKVLISNSRSSIILAWSLERWVAFTLFSTFSAMSSTKF
jgi:hypothetical protein